MAERAHEKAPCQVQNASWPQPCGKPSKATVVEKGSSFGKRLCGIHARSWERIGWKVERD